MRLILEKNYHIFLQLPIPMKLIINHATAPMACNILAKYGVYANREQLLRLVQSVKNASKRHPDWIVLEMESPDGTILRGIIK